MPDDIVVVDSNTVSITTHSVQTVSIDDLIQNVSVAQQSLADFEAWVLAERIARQAVIDASQASLSNATTAIQLAP